MKDRIKEILTAVLTVAIVGSAMFYIYCLSVAIGRADAALNNLESSENAEFSMGEYENVAKGRFLFVTVTRRDINKSRLAGRYAAEKSKEFLKGWMDGEKSESKHK